MIRPVTPHDAAAIARIYNYYIENSTATFDTERVSDEVMRERVASIAGEYPYLVDVEETGRLTAFCYAHRWKEKPAYRLTLETTLYCDPQCTGRGLGRALMERLIEECRLRGYHALIACITQGNEASDALHLKLGFTQVSQFSEVGCKFGKQLAVKDFELIL